MNPDLHLLAASYALDALDEHERAGFEAHLVRCEQCQIEVAELRATASRLAAARPVAPNPELRSRIMAAVAATPQVGPGPPAPPAPAVAPGLAVTLRPGVARGRRRAPGLPATTVNRRAAAAVLAVAAAVAVVAGALGAARLTGDRSPARPDEIAAAADARQLPLDGAVGTLKVIWSAADGELAVVGHGLPDPGEGRAYQLWLLGGPRPVSAGVFFPDGSGSVELIGRLPGEPAGWGVTVEPAAGSEQPTGDAVYQGSA